MNKNYIWEIIDNAGEVVKTFDTEGSADDFLTIHHDERFSLRRVKHSATSQEILRGKRF